jgi:hypothetical protein
MDKYAKALQEINDMIEADMKEVQAIIKANGIDIDKVGFMASNIMILMFSKIEYNKAVSFFANYMGKARVSFHENVCRISLIY